MMLSLTIFNICCGEWHYELSWHTLVLVKKQGHFHCLKNFHDYNILMLETWVFRNQSTYNYKSHISQVKAKNRGGALFSRWRSKAAVHLVLQLDVRFTLCYYVPCQPQCSPPNFQVNAITFVNLSGFNVRFLWVTSMKHVAKGKELAESSCSLLYEVCRQSCFVLWKIARQSRHRRGIKADSRGSRNYWPMWVLSTIIIWLPDWAHLCGGVSHSLLVLDITEPYPLSEPGHLI